MSEFEKDDIKIVWQKEKCQHAAKCVKGLPLVFKPKEKRWIQVEGGTKEDIIATVAQCPSGALTIKN
jgi:uncharacterized Fe-S cluster protein YjdI